MSEPTTAAGRDYETQPSTRAGKQLVSTYTILTPFVRAIEAEARAAATIPVEKVIAIRVAALEDAEVALERVHRERHPSHPGIAVCEYKSCTLREPFAAIDALRRTEG